MITETRKIPGPEPITNPLKFVAELQKINASPMNYFSDLLDTHGPIVSISMMGSEILLVSDPDLLQELFVRKAAAFDKDDDYTNTEKGLARFLGQGLVTSNGDFWKKQRKLIQPAFHTRRINDYAESMVALTEKRLATWEDGTERDIAEEMMVMTLWVVARTVLDVNLDREAMRIGEAVKIFNDFAGKNTILPTWVPTPDELAARQAKNTIDEIVHKLIQERRQRTDLNDANDLLSVLLLAEDEDGHRMSDEQIRDEAVTLISAGHETTANTLNWTWMLLSQNPDVEAKLHEELDRVLAGRIPTLDDLKQLPYTAMVIKESMRLYPAVWGVSRVANQDTELGGHPIKQGTVVAVSFAYNHRHPDYWEQADRFWPERFDEEREAQIPRYVYMPFGGGPRVCIGNAFAMMEAKLILATVAQRYKLRMKEGYQVKPMPRVTLYPKDGMPMRLLKRKAISQSAALIES